MNWRCRNYWVHSNNLSEAGSLSQGDSTQILVGKFGISLESVLPDVGLR